MLEKKLANGVVIESFSLTEHQFERACQLYEIEHRTGEFDSLVESDAWLDGWLSQYSPLEPDEVEWLKCNVDRGADIYTYRDGWQDIGEIAVVG